jgi:hypothetical protein
MFCSNSPEQWKKLLSVAEFSHNQKEHSVMNKPPFYLMMGYIPTPLPLAFDKTNIPSNEQRIAILQKARDEALACHELARQKMMGRTKRDLPTFRENDQVWLDARNLKVKGLQKLLAKREGPFKIEKVLGPVTFQLKLPDRWKIHPVFHAGLLTPFVENETHGPNFLRPHAELVEGEEEYLVEAIVGHRRRGRTIEYLIKWEGYPTSENSWEPKKNLTHSKELLNAYNRRHRIR